MLLCTEQRQHSLSHQLALSPAGSDLGGLCLDGLATLLELGSGLEAHVAPSPATHHSVVELLLEVGLELCALDVILALFRCKDKLLVHEVRANMLWEYTQVHVLRMSCEHTLRPTVCVFACMGLFPRCVPRAS